MCAGLLSTELNTLPSRASLVPFQRRWFESAVSSLSEGSTNVFAEDAMYRAGEVRSAGASDAEAATSRHYAELEVDWTALEKRSQQLHAAWQQVSIGQLPPVTDDRFPPGLAVTQRS